MNSSPEIKDLAEALSKAQGEIKQPHKSKTAKVPMKTGGSYSYKYADLADIIECLKEPFKKYGLSYLQGVTTKGGGVVVTTRLMHSSGQFIEEELWMPVGDDRPQTLGSIITYGRRYALAAMVGIAPDDDDDGQQAQEVATGEKLGTPAPRATARAKNTQTTILAEAKSTALKGGYDPNDRVKQDWLIEDLKSRNIPDDKWDDIGNAMVGQPSSKLSFVIANVMGNL